MDLGSGICTPKNPKCCSCPLSSICKACEEGEPERYPLRPAPMVKREENWTILLIQNKDGMVIRRRDEKKLLGGLYEFPSVEGHLSSKEIEQHLLDSGYCILSEPVLLPPAKHVFTHLIWRMQGWLIEVQSIPAETLLADAEGIRSRAFPSAIRKYRELALEQLEKDL
jgi:A/G-specific adenine glycosylase